MVIVRGNTAEFTFFRPQATKVQLAGDFNGWMGQGYPMERTPEGYWKVRLELPSGDFRFRYCADGEWFADYAAFGLELGPFGLDSVVRVPTSSEPPQRRSA